MRAWDARIAVGNEADDELAFAQTKDTCICSIDKDLDQIVGKHFHPGIKRSNVFIREPKLYTITEEQALYFFYYQLLVGDNTDNIKGAIGIGPKKAHNILEGNSTPLEYYNSVVPFFSCEEELLLNARCIKIGQRPNELWKPPTE